MVVDVAVPETFCCMICRLLQERSPACIECGAATMVSLETGSDALKYANLSISSTPTTRKEKIANASTFAALLAGYAGIAVGATLWWPAVPIFLGLGVGGVGLTAAFARDVNVAKVELLPIATGKGAVEKRGVVHKLAAPVVVEQVVIRAKRGGILMRRTTAVPFVLDADGERIVIAGTPRIAGGATERKLKKADPLLAALGIPPHIALAGVVETTAVHEGDRVRVTGVLSREIIPELAFHRDAGETTVMRGVANAVVAIEKEAA
jgi:hypothetical protein